MRIKYACLAFLVLVGYLLFIFAVILFQGFGCWEFSLSDGVLMSLIASSAATATVLVLGVINGLFRVPKKKKRTGLEYPKREERSSPGRV